MKSLFYFIITLMLGSLMGCGSSSVTTFKSGDDNYIEMLDNTFSSDFPDFVKMNTVDVDFDINFAKIQNAFDSSQLSYNIYFYVYNISHNCKIEIPNENISFKVDGEEIIAKVSSITPPKDEKMYYYSNAFYDISKEDMIRMSNAKKIETSIQFNVSYDFLGGYGKQVVKLESKNKNIEKFKEFVQKYIN